MNPELQSALDELSDLEETLKKKKAQIRRIAIQEAQRLIEQLDIQPDELDFSGRSAEERKAKYRGPEGQLWTGRGRQPNWIVEAVKNGADISDFEIK